MNADIVKTKSNKIGAAVIIVEIRSDYKQTNTEIAKQVVCKYLDLNPKSVSNDFFRGEMPCRMEKFLYKGTVVYLDVCHNDQGMQASLELLSVTDK